MGDIGGALRVNPFSPSAVARIALEGNPPVTLQTGAIDEAMGYLTGYLAPGPGELNDVRPDGEPESGQPARRPGYIVAILGDYGTGKTHLAVHLLRQAARVADESLVVHRGYLEASAKSFDQMYRDLVASLDRDVVLKTVRDYYADVVADSLAGSPLTGETAVQLRNREVDPDEVVDDLGLIDSLLSRQLRDALISVTRTEAFGTALAMLLRRKEFAEDVWNWLTGRPPTRALVERGITEPIAGDNLVLEAMGVFAYLYGRRRHRFVLVIDELDKILTGQPDPTATVDAFKKLFQVFQSAGACLVVVGLPDLLDVLGPSAKDRITHKVDMPLLEGDDVRRLIELTHERAFGEPTLSPFEPGTPEFIADLAHGSARQVIRLCHGAFQLAIRDDLSAITQETVREVVQARESLPAPSRIRDKIREVLRWRGLSFRPDVTLPGLAAPVDFWVSVGADPVGCAIVVARSVVTEAAADELVEHAGGVRQAQPGSTALLVIGGYLDSRLRPRLTEAFGAEPIEFRRGDRLFETEFGAAIEQAMAEVRRAGPREDGSAQLAERLGWLSQQQVHAQGYLERLASRVDELRTSVDHQLTAVRRELHTPSSPGSAARSTVLPPEVDRVFQDAMEVLGRFEWMGPTLRTTMSVSGDPAEVGARQRGFQARLNTAETHAAIGVASLIRDLVKAFRSGVEEWYQSGESAPQPLGAGGLDALSALCLRYETIYFDLQRARLDEYPPPPAGTVTAEEEGEQADWARRTADARDYLDNLGAYVQDAAWRSADGGVDGEPLGGVGLSS